MSKSKFFFCYNKRLSDFFKKKGIDLITVAIDPNTRKWYSLYEITPVLQQAIDEYKQQTTSKKRSKSEEKISY